MDTQILEDLGLTNAEIRVYVALLELGSSSAGKIIEKSGLQNSVVHRALNSLIEKGLISYIKEGKRTLMVVNCTSRCKPEEKEKLFKILNKKRVETTKEDILWVKALFEKYDSVQYAREMARQLIGEAKAAISGMLPEMKTVLGDFADYMIERKK